MKKKGFNLIHVIIIIIVTSLISSITVGLILYNNINGGTESRYLETLADKNIKEFLNVYAQITDDYYQKVDNSVLIDGAIKGMLSSLNENYTSYMNEEDNQLLQDKLNGKTFGIGILLEDNVITEIYENSPAEKSGLKVGDAIIQVNGQDLSNNTEKQLKQMETSSSENLHLLVEREGRNIEIDTKAEEIKLKTVKFSEKNGIGIMNIEIFGTNTGNEVASELQKLNNKNIQKLIIDLRDNTGGYLEQAKKVASLFLSKGKIIYTLKNKNEITEYKDNDENSTSFPIIVLINNKTASAAEILAASLKDSYDAIIVGTQSYGKGKVQHMYYLNSGALVKYTSSSWLRPNGSSVDNVGIKPDYYIENTDLNKDNQLLKAIDLLLS